MACIRPCTLSGKVAWRFSERLVTKTRTMGFRAFSSGYGSAVERVKVTLTATLRSAVWEASPITGIVFLIFSGYHRSPDAIASFATASDEEERRWMRSTST